MSQKSFWEVCSHALVCAGASPKYSATWALTSGEEIQFIHLYMQFGCLAFDEIIQVSDQPVAPSLGFVASTFGASVFRTLTWYCQAVPQYLLTRVFCCLSRSLAAASCVSSRAYGLVIPRAGFVFIR